MNSEYTNLEKVLAVILACLATGIWRLIGVIFYNKISENGKKRYFELFDHKIVSDFLISKIFLNHPWFLSPKIFL